MDLGKVRRILYNEALEIDSKLNISKINDFKKQFWRYLENVIISLYNDENAFFGQFLVQVKRELRFDIKWPIATKPEMGEFTMYFNPVLLLECDLVEVQALLKHEIYHIMMGHYERERYLKNKYSTLAISIAMDISINQYIKNLPAYCKRLQSINLEYDLELGQDMTMEQYAAEIEKAINHREKYKIKTNKKNIDKHSVVQEDAHEVWGEVLLSTDNLKNSTKKISLNAYKGSAPKEIEKIILLMKEKSEIKWSEFLRKLLILNKGSYKKTITRRDRRMPDRIDLRGKLPSTIPKILIAIDISASMKDKDIEKIIREVLEIVKDRRAEIKVIECDSEIRKIYKLKSIKDIQPRSNKNGSTKFSPVFKYIKENNMRDYALIYFTDGIGEKELEIKPINYITLWVLTDTNDLSLNKSYGSIKKLKSTNNEKYDKNYGLQALNDSINYWAR